METDSFLPAGRLLVCRCAARHQECTTAPRSGPPTEYATSRALPALLGAAGCIGQKGDEWVGIVASYVIQGGVMEIPSPRLCITSHEYKVQDFSQTWTLE